MNEADYIHEESMLRFGANCNYTCFFFVVFRAVTRELLEVVGTSLLRF